MTQAVQLLREYITTLDRIEARGLELKMCTYRTCETVFCQAGWMAYFRGKEDGRDVAWEILDNIGYPIEKGIRIWGKVFDILFGGGRDVGRTQAQTIQLLRNAANWFMHRQLSLENYNNLRAMPRKERRKLGLAA